MSGTTCFLTYETSNWCGGRNAINFVTQLPSHISNARSGESKECAIMQKMGISKQFNTWSRDVEQMFTLRVIMPCDGQAEMDI
jgi:hypothetical protein